MILKRNFNLLKVYNYIKQELHFSIITSLCVYLCFCSEVINVYIPFSSAAILGSALTIFIAFRNNSAYGGWWEARTLWGGIVNSSRVLARLIISFADSHAHRDHYEKGRSESFKKELVYLAIAWVHALRLHLRGLSEWQELRLFISKEELSDLALTSNKPNYIHLLTGRKIYQAMANGTLGGFDSFQLEGQLLALANYQGAVSASKTPPY